jgi:hypothetical protein
MWMWMQMMGEGDTRAGLAQQLAGMWRRSFVPRALGTRTVCVSQFKHVLFGAGFDEVCNFALYHLTCFCLCRFSL